MASSPTPFPHLPSARKGTIFRSAIPTQIVSNEEFAPLSRTADQARVEQLAAALVERTAARRGLTRRDFLKTTGGMAAALLAMNSVFGRFFNIGEIEWMDDEKIAYPMLEQARKLNIKRVCVHKGLPLGPVPDYSHPKDLIKAARDFPDIDFLVYHSGLKSTSTVEEVFAKTGEIPWTTEFCRMKEAQPGIKNIYMELGSTFAQLVTTHPAVCAHLLGRIIEAFGVDHVLWGTDAIWYGTPQWQIEAFRRFQIPDQLIERHRYQPLTRQVKEQIFGLNAARVFGVDAKAKRNEVPQDVLGQLRMSYLEEGPEPSRKVYGWVVG